MNSFSAKCVLKESKEVFKNVDDRVKKAFFYKKRVSFWTPSPGFSGKRKGFVCPSHSSEGESLSSINPSSIVIGSSETFGPTFQGKKFLDFFQSQCYKQVFVGIWDCRSDDKN